MVTDTKYGAAHYGCMICCALNPFPELTPNPVNLLQNDIDPLYGDATNSCTHATVDITSYLTTWTSDNTSIATAQAAQVTGVAVGSTTVYGDGFLPGGTNGTIDDPNGCPETEATMSGPTNVYDFDVSSAESISDGGQGSFSVTVTNGTAQAYSWDFTEDNGTTNGNNPEVTFNLTTSAQTSTDAHWFAAFGTVCATSSPTYDIFAVVTFSGDSLPHRKKTYLTVNLPTPGGKEDEATIDGSVDIALFSDGLWRVTDQGTLTRVIATPDIFVLNTSQFNSKVTAHENKHVTQWQSGLFSQLYTVSGFYSTISGFTDSTSAGLETQINSAFATYISQQHQQWQSLSAQAEQEAYTISDPISPLFFYQSQCSGF